MYPIHSCFTELIWLCFSDSVSRSAKKKEPRVADLVRASAGLGGGQHEVTGSGGLHVTGPHAEQFK